MWRREERLRFWLENGSQAQESGFGSGLVKKLSLKLRLRNATCAVQEESLDLSTGAVCLDDDLAATACVRDGLEEIKQGLPPEPVSISGIPACDDRIHHVMLIGDAIVYDTRLPDERLARIRQKKVEMTPACLPYQLSLRAAEVHELAHPHNQPPLIMDGNRFLIANPSVQNLTSQISELPHVRTSIRIEGLRDSERHGFLREAEVLKGVPSDRAQLLAVFRHVPIEVVSRMHFLAEKKTILYSISREAKPIRTRLHDMAAVLDIASREIYLVPHRTQFQAVTLN